MRRPLWHHRLLALLLFAGVLVGILLAERHERALDVTANARHSLAPASIAVARSLKRPVEVIAAIGPDPVLRRAVSELVARYRKIDPRIALHLFNPETDPARARRLDVPPGGLVLLRSGRRERRLETVSERAMTGALRQLARDGDRRIAFITGHGERRPDLPGNHDWQALAERLAVSGVESVAHSLVSDAALDARYDAVVLAAPLRDFFPGEIAQLRHWLDGGGHLLWARETGDAAAGDALSVLSTILGVEALPGRVIDTASATLDLGAPDFVVLDRFADHPIVRGLGSPVLLPGVRALEVTPLAGQEEAVLLRSPASSWTETGALRGAVSFDEAANERAGPLVLGLTIEREIAGGLQRIALTGDADFAASQYLGNGSNAAFAESLLLWLTGGAEEVEFVTPAPPDAHLALGRSAIVGWTVTLLLVLPAGCVAIAVVLAWRRRIPRS